jgi:uncharacterized protein YndB with AHSA1/START domain
MGTTATTTANDSYDAPAARGLFDAQIRLERVYAHPRAKVWQALTDPRLIAAWLMRAEGFAPRPGCKFRLRAKPQPGWRGYVDCEGLAVDEGRLLRYSWAGDDRGPVLTVTWTLEDAPGGGTCLRLVHDGFRGAGGFILAKLMMGPGWKKMMRRYLASVLDRLDDAGRFTPDPRLDKFSCD